MNKYAFAFFGVVLAVILVHLVDFIYLSAINRNTCIEGCSAQYNRISNWLFIVILIISGILGYLRKLKKISYLLILVVMIFMLLIWLIRTWYGLDYGYGLNLSY